MTAVAAVSATIALATLALFQLALIAGAPIGQFAWGGQNRVLPTRFRVGSAISVVLYLLIALILLQRGGLIAVFGSDAFVQVAAWVLFGYFVLGIVMNGISRSKPERNTMVPVTVVLSVLSLIVALG